MGVSESSRKLDPTETLLRRKLVEDAQTPEYLTHTGLDKTPPTNSSKLSALIQTIRPSEETPELTGSALKSTTKENSEVLPPLVRSTEVSDKRVTEPLTEDHQLDKPGRREIPK